MLTGVQGISCQYTGQGILLQGCALSGLVGGHSAGDTLRLISSHLDVVL